MTEAEWLACTISVNMLRFLDRKAGNRNCAFSPAPVAGVSGT